jgi:hypothetical protein
MTRSNKVIVSRESGILQGGTARSVPEKLPMFKKNSSLVRPAIGASLLLLSFGCMSTTPDTASGGASPVGTGGDTANGGAGAVDSGISGSGGASVCPVANPGVPTCDGTGTNMDPSCNSTCAKKGHECTQDCCIPCGINALGSRVCYCPTTTYSQCICAQPATWPTGLHGGACEPQGLSTSSSNTPPGAFSVRGQPCSTEWTVCFTSDGIATGGLGCICLKDPATGNLTMNCGTINGWFTYDTGVTTPYK